MISVLILTHNEENDLPDCLRSVAWSDDVYVFDSNSTDRTVEIAHSHGAKVIQRRFDGYASQRNAALTGCPFKHPWIFILDADERPTPELSAEMQRMVAHASEDVAAYRLRRRDFLWNTWLRHAQITPFYVRLVRLGRARYVREVNEALEIDGNIADLAGPLDHYPFSKGMTHWLTKHNTYSTMEAELLVSGLATKNASLRVALFAKDFHDRRAAQKAIFYKVPARPLFKWCYMVFFRRAILDGAAGITYATLQSFYEYMIEVKRKDLMFRKEQRS